MSDLPPIEFEWPEELSRERPPRSNVRTLKPNGGEPQQNAPQSPKASAKPVPLDWPVLAGQEPPERRWATRGWVGFGHVTLLVGPGGIGKTLLAQQMASCWALGKSFIGDVQGPLKCLMWACEDDHDELWRRQVALARWCDAGLDAFAERLVIVPRHGLENTLVSTEFGKLVYSPLINELSEQAADLAAEVVILDNVGQLYGGGENDRHAVTAFLNTLSGALPGRALLLLAHPSRSSGSEFSGSSAWENVVRTRLFLGATLPGEKPDPEAEPQDNVRYLARRKANYSPKDWRKLTYAAGALTPDVVESGGGVVASIRASNAERTVLTGIAKLTGMGIPASDGTRSSQYLPKLLAEYKIDDGLSRRDTAGALRVLMVAGRIARGQVGKRANRTAMVGLVVVDAPQQT
jgi:hypothetical protein